MNQGNLRYEDLNIRQQSVMVCMAADEGMEWWELLHANYEVDNDGRPWLIDPQETH